MIKFNEHVIHSRLNLKNAINFNEHQLDFNGYDFI